MLRKHLKTTTGLVLAAGISFLASGAQATVITNGTIFPNVAITPAGNNQINVGFSGNSGEVEVNADAAGNGFTEVSGSGLLVGNGVGATGEVRIIGNGTSGSAKVTINDGIGARIGFGGEGTLSIQQGGTLLSNEQIHLGEDANNGAAGTTNVTVDGEGSILRSQTADGAFADGGRIFVPFSSANTNLTVSNGGLVDAVGGNIDEFEDGAIFIGDFGDATANVNVNVTGEGSAIQAQHGIFVQNQSGQAVVNITDGGAMTQLEQGFVFDGDVSAGISIDSFEADGARVTVSGASVGGVSSSLSAATDIDIGIERAVVGFTAAGEPRLFFDGSAAIGDHITDQQGNPLFDRDGNPVLGAAVDFGGFIVVLPNTFEDAGGDPILVKSTGHLLVENGAVASTDANINVSTNNADSRVAPVSGQASSLIVRNGGVVTAENVFVNTDGRLSGDGTIFGNVIVDGGTVAPGNSPGTMTINGDFVINDGTLELEINSLLDMDEFIVSGDVVLGAAAMIDLVLGFEPSDILDIEDFFSGFSLFQIDDNFDPFANIDVMFAAGLGLPSGGIVNIGLGGEVFALSAGGDGATTVSEPGALALLGFGLGGLLVARRRRRKIVA